jgi:integrase
MNNVYEFPTSPSKSDITRYRYIQQQAEVSQTEAITKVQSGDTGLPILITSSGFLHEHANNFLLTRFFHFDFFNQLVELNSRKKTFKKVTINTLNNYADHIRNWLNICESQGVSYLEVDEAFLNGVLEIFRDPDLDDNEMPITERSIENYVDTWRLFYNYLSLMKISHKMTFPNKVTKTRDKTDAEKNSDMYNYAHSSTTTYQDDPLIKNSRIIKIKNYASQALTEYQFNMLLEELGKIDLVYKIMAKVQLDTLMRINEIVHYFPYEANNLNPDWMNFAMMRQSNMDFQVLHFIGKGQIKRNIDVDIRTMKFIDDYYLTAKLENINADVTIYDYRKSLFLSNFLKSKHGKKSNYNYSSDIIWLTKTGRPVSKTMYRNAFKKAAKILRATGIINMRTIIRPHGLRHTGTTLRLVKYGEETGIDISVSNIDDIAAFLRELLGHCDENTIRLYISTVRKLPIGELGKKTMHEYKDKFGTGLHKHPSVQKELDKF